jgi:hypothetical protein
MEIDENDFIAPDPEPAAPVKSGLRITPELGGYLREISLWALIFLGITAVFFVLSMIQNYRTYARLDSDGETLGSILNTTILGLLLVGMPGWFAYQFAVNVRKGLQSESPGAMEKGFQNLRGLYAFFGIMTILYLGLMLLAVAVAVTFSGQFPPMG